MNDSAGRDSKYAFEQIEKMYRSYGKYYTDIIHRMSDKIMNWAFALNTGGIFATVGFMGAVIKKSSIPISGFLVTMGVFGLGILSIVIAAMLEQKRFERLGKFLEKSFSKYNSNADKKTAVNDFLTEVSYEDSCHYYIVCILEIVSHLLFLIGLIVAVCFLIYK